MARPLESSCGLDNALRVISGKWKPTLLWVLHDRPAHFGEIRRGISGLSEKILMEQLRELETDGLVLRLPEEGPGRRVRYQLSDRGQTLNAALHALAQWGSHSEPEAARAVP